MKHSKATDAVHAGTLKDEKYFGVNSPIYTSTAFGYLETDERLYPRYFNVPNQEVLIKKLSVLEKGEDALLFSSGMAAITTTLLTFLKPGDHAVFQNDIYGGTHHFISGGLPGFGIEYTFTDATDLSALKGAIKSNTKLIYIESPSNPLLKVVDLDGVAKIARDRQLLTVIDNTFASPINLNPISFGIDVVIHSGTKYLGGHSDIIAGAAISTRAHIDKIRNNALNFGGNLNAQTCYLLERSLKTLDLRVGKQSSNALSLAIWLEKHPRIRKVYYPGLESHTGHDIARKQMTGFGGVVSFEIAGDQSQCSHFLKNLKLISPALSLGGVESTICVPAQTSHKKISAAERAKAGITDTLLRLSTGIEDVDDLKGDIEQALMK